MAHAAIDRQIIDNAACLAEIMRLRYRLEAVCRECRRKTNYCRIAKR